MTEQMISEKQTLNTNISYIYKDIDLSKVIIKEPFYYPYNNGTHSLVCPIIEVNPVSGKANTYQMGELVLSQKNENHEAQAENFLEILEAYNTANLLQHMDYGTNSKYEEKLLANGTIAESKFVNKEDQKQEKLKYIYQNGMDLSAIESSKTITINRSQGYDVTSCEVKYHTNLKMGAKYIGASPLATNDTDTDKSQSIAGDVFAIVMQAYVAANEAIQNGKAPDANDMDVLYENRFTKDGFKKLSL